MGQRGPKPKPTALRNLQGNPGKRPINKNEPAPTKGQRVPNCPAWLNEDAAALWRQHAKRLWDLGLLTHVDVGALAALCETEALYHTAVQKLAEGDVVHVTDKGYHHASAWVQIRSQALKQLKSLWSEFGMTPASRSRVVVVGEEKEVDPYAAFLNSETAQRKAKKSA